MKRTLRALIATTLLTTSINAFSQAVLGTSVSSTGLTAALVESVTETVMSPFVSSSATTLAAARVELEAVQADANDYLAGADKTEMLDEVIQKIRTNSKEDLSVISDAEIAVEILEVTL